MPIHIITEVYSRYADLETGKEFAPILDRRSGLYLGHAEADTDEEAEHWRTRRGFEVFDQEGFIKRITPDAAEAGSADQVEIPTTGDALADAAKQGGPMTRDEANLLNLEALRAEAEIRGIKVKSNATRSQLIDLILAAGEASTASEGEDVDLSGPPAPPASQG